ncbi:hypothetical protein D9619_011996 [Psilocybe cf. subviscida]|uniref:Uncharacterized protein n=1 Tax=Psilocybe cf. subviscida TaxID=2480587 RepID=A0A8H5B0Q1_9AGAR|nr:hypothetical protein D9619_011996 [Psilocybe cf. subviscida]
MHGRRLSRRWLRHDNPQENLDGKINTSCKMDETVESDGPATRRTAQREPKLPES